MAVNGMHAVVHKHVLSQNYKRILDIGGWHIPYPLATHVVDLLPWETRGGQVQLEQLEGEHFSHETWICADVTDASRILPFPDKFFDFAMCSGTLEDLKAPSHCASELRRVARAGYIRVPSMIEEITIGVEDRTNDIIGYDHHHWVCRASDDLLTMMRKPKSIRRYIPLLYYEKLCSGHQIKTPDTAARNIHFFWNADFHVEFLPDNVCLDEIEQCVGALNIPIWEYFKDYVLRSGRKVRDFVRGRGGFRARKTDWWQHMLEISKPYAENKMYVRAGGSP